MHFPLKPQRLKRYKDIVLLLVKYGRRDLVQASDLDRDLLMEDMRHGMALEGRPEQLAHDLETLGPTFIKLGQMFSTRADLLPQPYLEALSRLQDKIAPFPFEQVERIVSQELRVRLSKAFPTFSTTPVAAASLGQVHWARLRDGREVAVKVQRPGIRQVILDDFDALDEIAAQIDRHTVIGRQYVFRDQLDSFRRTLLRELDYRQEAENQRLLGRNLAPYSRLVVPQPYHDYTSSRVLTMDFVRGTKITALSPLARLDYDCRGLAEDLFRAYLDQVLVDGFFHADPHPGNVFVTQEGKLALIDLGMTAHVDPAVQENLLKLLLAIGEGRGHDAAGICMKLGQCLEDCQRTRFTREVADIVARYKSASHEQVAEGRIVMEMTRAAAENGVRPAPELSLLGKALLHLDEASRTLDPHFDAEELMHRHGEAILRRRMLKSLAPGHLLGSLLDTQRLTRRLPERLDVLLEHLVEDRLEIRVKAIDEDELRQNLQKIANRIAVALVLAALIVGAAMIMSIETEWTFLGYPALAMVMFLLAAGCGFALVFDIWLQDRPRRERKPPR